MLGHDFIPHVHANKDHISGSTAIIPNVPANGLTDIQNAFSRFQHNSCSSQLIYLNTSEKVTNSQPRNFHPIPFLVTIEFPQTWYANFKKQRFWKYGAIPLGHRLSPQSLRGPPSC